MTATPPDTSNAGIRQLSNGASVIPASTRADGSVRKEIRVKPGYRPPEDVEVYKNRTAEGWKNRGDGRIPGAEAVAELEPAAAKATVAANKNAKRREARKRAAAAAADENEGTKPARENNVVDEAVKASTLAEVATNKAVREPSVEADAAKEARKLAKKLRQAKELQAQKDKGGSLLPEQLAKVIKINDLVRQLDALGFDSEGEKKGDGTTQDGPEPVG